MPRPGLCRMDQSEVLEGPQNVGFAAHTAFETRHSLEAMGSGFFEEGRLVLRYCDASAARSGLPYGVEFSRLSTVFQLGDRNRCAVGSAVGGGEFGAATSLQYYAACPQTKPRRQRLLRQHAA